MLDRTALDADTVIAARNGDERALGDVLRRLERVFRAFFVSRLGRRDEVDDLVQNSLVRVHSSLADLNDPARLKAFAMKAAFFELQDLYRGRYSPKEILFDPSDPPEGYVTESVGDGLDLDRALGQLSDHARRILELREYGFRYEEIAGMMETTEAAVKMQVKRAFEKLREVLATIAALIILVFS